MARRKKATAKKHTVKRRRRSRMGAISSDTKSLLMQTVGGIAGAVVGSYVGRAVKDMIVETSATMEDYAPYIDGGVQVVAGFFLPKIIKKSSPLLKGMQAGLLINGGLTIVKATGALDALGAISDTTYKVPFLGAANGGMDARSADVPFLGAASVSSKYAGAYGGNC